MDTKPIKSDFDSELGQRLKRLRQIKGLSQRELAKRSGITHSNISIIEQGQVSPSVQSLARILQPLGLSLIDFFGCANSSASRTPPDSLGASNIALLSLNAHSPADIKLDAMRLRMLVMTPHDEVQLFASGDSAWLVVTLEGCALITTDTQSIALAQGHCARLPPSCCVGLAAHGSGEARLLITNCR